MLIFFSLAYFYEHFKNKIRFLERSCKYSILQFIFFSFHVTFFFSIMLTIEFETNITKVYKAKTFIYVLDNQNS